MFVDHLAFLCHETPVHMFYTFFVAVEMIANFLLMHDLFVVYEN